jgi:hypothetical protein
VPSRLVAVVQVAERAALAEAREAAAPARRAVRQVEQLRPARPVLQLRARSAAVSGVPNGPAQIGGPNNAVNDPSGVLNADKNPTSPGTVGVAPSRPTVPQGATPRDNGTVNEPSVGTNSLGTASPSGGTSGNVARRDNGTLAPGPGKPTVTQEQDSDAKINEENRRLNRAMNNICRGC